MVEKYLVQLQKLHKTTEMAALKTQALLNSIKKPGLLSHFSVSEVTMTVDALCFQLAQMNELPKHCQKLRTFCTNPHELQTVAEIERGLLIVRTLSREIVLLLEKERKDLKSILQTMESSSKNLYFFHQLASTSH